MITYGYSVQEGDDPLVNIANVALEEFSLSTAPGAWLVDILPICKERIMLLVRPLYSCMFFSAICPILVSRRQIQKDRSDLG